MSMTIAKNLLPVFDRLVCEEGALNNMIKYGFDMVSTSEMIRQASDLFNNFAEDKNFIPVVLTTGTNAPYIAAKKKRYKYNMTF